MVTLEGRGVYTLLIFTPQYSALPVAMRPVPLRLPAAAPRWPVAGGRRAAWRWRGCSCVVACGGWGLGGPLNSPLPLPGGWLSHAPRYGRCGHSPQTPRPSREARASPCERTLWTVHCAHTTGYVASFQPSSPSATTLSGPGSLSPVRGAGNVRLIRGAAEHVHVEANGRECEKRCASRQNRPHARQPWSARVWGEKARGPGERGGFGT